MSHCPDDEISIDPEFCIFNRDNINNPQHNPVSHLPFYESNIDLGSMEYNPSTGSMKLSGPPALIAGLLGLAGFFAGKNDNGYERQQRREAERREAEANEKAEKAEKEKKEADERARQAELERKSVEEKLKLEEELRQM